MDINLTINIVLAIATIASLVLFITLYKRKKPTWAYTTRQVIGRDAESPPELKYIFGSTEVEEVYQTTVIFFNGGNEKYCGDLVPMGNSDINEAIVIEFRGAQVLRPPIIKNRSKGVANKFSVEKTIKDEVEAVELHFPILGHHDGAMIDVWHTKLEEKPCIQNADVKLLKEFTRERPRNFYSSIFTSSFFVVFLLLIMVYAFTNLKSLGDMIIVGLLAVFLVYVVYETSKTFRYRRFPSWCRTDKTGSTKTQKQ